LERKLNMIVSLFYAFFAEGSALLR
jgi:hypothetical protein